MVLPDVRSDSGAQALRFASAANFVAAVVLFPWVVFVTALCVAGSMAARESGVDEGARDLAVLLGAIGLSFLWGVAALHLMVGWCIARRRAYRLTLVASAVTAFNPTCLPIGLVVAGLTWYALRRPSVRSAFGGRAS